MQYITPKYKCFCVDISSDLNFSGLITLVASQSKLNTNQIYVSFQCPRLNINMYSKLNTNQICVSFQSLTDDFLTWLTSDQIDSFRV